MRRAREQTRKIPRQTCVILRSSTTGLGLSGSDSEGRRKERISERNDRESRHCVAYLGYIQQAREEQRQMSATHADVVRIGARERELSVPMWFLRRSS